MLSPLLPARRVADHAAIAEVLETTSGRKTLALSIVERTRELGLLRAVEMSRRQLRAMIGWEPS
ncbi:MAG: hypothetical protein M3179_07345 [Actinomycetota bacterium]|nr:hypothetical protein [Actinomycetota bacterium]